MPNRILREGILTSPRMAKLGWAEEVFYRRLMSVVDDFGRYWADSGLLRAACYPRQLNKVSDSDIGKWLRACADAALVRVYPAEDGESYLELLDFRQQVRAKDSKFPSPAVGASSTAIKGEAPASNITSDDASCVADAAQTTGDSEASAPVFVCGDVSEDGGEGDARARRTRPSAAQRPEAVSEDVWRDWLALRKAKRAPVTPTVLEEAERESAKAGMSLHDFLRVWCARGSQGLQADWIKPHERGSSAAPMESTWQREARENVERMTGGLVSARRPQQQKETIDGCIIESRHAALGR